MAWAGLKEDDWIGSGLPKPGDAPKPGRTPGGPPAQHSSISQHSLALSGSSQPSLLLSMARTKQTARKSCGTQVKITRLVKAEPGRPTQQEKEKAKRRTKRGTKALRWTGRSLRLGGVLRSLFTRARKRSLISSPLPPLQRDSQVPEDCGTCDLQGVLPGGVCWPSCKGCD